MRHCRRSIAASGFTVLEVLVALCIVLLLAGGMFGLMSSGINAERRSEKQARAWSVLDAAAQQVLSSPELAYQGEILVKELPGTPRVDVALGDRLDLQPQGNEKAAELARITLAYEGQSLDLSLIVPRQ